MYKQDLELNNLLWLICHKNNKQTRPLYIYIFIYIYILQAFPTVFLFTVVAFSSSLVLYSFISFSLNCAPHIIIKGIAIWGTRWPDIRGYVVTEISSLAKIGSPACVALRRLLLSNVVSSRSHPLDPELPYLLKALDVDLRVKSEAMWEECGHDVTITIDPTKHRDVD